MRITTCGLLLTACSVLGCQHEQTPEQISENENRSTSKTVIHSRTTEFETKSPWPPTYAFKDEDSKSFTYAPSIADWDTVYVDKEEFIDHDLRVRVVMRSDDDKETLHAIKIERLGQEGFLDHAMFRAPHELPRLLHLLSRAYDTYLSFDHFSGSTKHMVMELVTSQAPSDLNYRPTLPPPHNLLDKYKKVADFTMDDRRVRLHERVGQNVLFADLCSARQFSENGEHVYRVDSPSDIKTPEDLLNVIRLFNAAYDQSMQHLRRATPMTVANSE